MDIITLPDPFPGLEFGAHVFWQPATQPSDVLSDPCLVARAAYDIGSSSTKVIGAVVDVCNLTIEQIFNMDSYPILYREDLYQSPTNEFSDLVQELGLATLASAKSQVEKNFQQAAQKAPTIEHCAVATAAFRVANNGESYVEHLSHELHIPVKVISQEEEGKLAYYSALLNMPDEKPLVWDIGGGSMQLTYKNQQGDFVMVGTELASHTFHQMVVEKICAKHSHESPHPMDPQQVQAALSLAKEKLATDTISTQLREVLQKESMPIVAVGSVHNFTIQPWCNLLAKATQSHYTRADVQQAINLLTSKSDFEILQLMDNLPKEFVKDQLTNLILAYAVMDELDVQEVRTLQVNNAQGLLIKGCD